ncbi:MAGUK p55 subfamily member 3 [Amazona aestiva]|uniref:MAGUK p55 subfamily member 3 n=1 Tax=Amazona aestiva TaxID=12930 RepID=A0A0Q3PDY0_AMAAE|nr:MAGUK p55 subfamily member 3 [Amazona aestiva]
MGPERCPQSAAAAGDAGLHETLALLTSQLRPDSNHKEEMGFLRDVFSEKSLNYLMKVIEELQTAPVNHEEKELLQLLSTPHLRAMLLVHDTVAQKNFDPVLPPLPDNFDDDFDEESVKIVRLVKNQEPLAQSQGSITLKIIPAIKEEDRLKDSKSFNIIPTLPFMLTTDDQSSDKAGLRRSFRLSRKEKENSLNEGKQVEQTDAAEFLTYEEVTKYQQQPGEQQRLVVLIDTTRSKKSHEKEGVEYNFVSKQSFETDVQQNKFVEHGEYKENLYGTSLEAIRSVMAKKKVCLVDVVPEAVKHLRTPEFKPYVIFVKPLVPEKKKHVLKSPMSEEISVPLDEEQQEIINSAAFIEEQYGHLIDTILVKEDLQSACNQLKTVLEKLNKDSFWVPVNWVRS